MPPPPYYNDDDTSPETFQSCVVSCWYLNSLIVILQLLYAQFRLYLRVEGNVDRVDMFEIEVVENIPLTKVHT